MITRDDLLHNNPSATWDAWYERRDKCANEGVHTTDDDLRHACKHSENTGSLTVLSRGPWKYKRCNIFLCPHKKEVASRAKTIYQEVPK